MLDIAVSINAGVTSSECHTTMLNITEFASLMAEVAAIPAIPSPPASIRHRGPGHKVTEQMRADVIAYSKETGYVARVVGYHFGISQTTTSIILREGKAKEARRKVS